MRIIAKALAGAVCLAALPGAGSAAPQPVAPAAAPSEVFYQIFMRSFRDSNGDRIGDFRGLTEKLDYLASLKVTSILLTPIQPSPFYHNYFATGFEGIDPAFGTMEEYFAFVRGAHARGLKVYLDQEFQYVAEGHPWLTQARGNPRSPNSGYVLWNRAGNQEPEPFLTLPAWPSWDGRYIGIAMVDLSAPKVKRYFEQRLLFWTDPHGDGSLRDGVDGFRIDHMMDDLDNKHWLTNLFADFWSPIFASLKARNPHLRILAEQSDWGYGEDWLTRGHADLVFAFPLRGALATLDKRKIEAAIRDTAARTPPGKSQIVFLENHDVDRFMTLVGGDPRRARVAAALNILLQGEPLLYYGQEIGLRGRVRPSGLSDAAHIPLREAMRWDRDIDAAGSATWYRADEASWSGRYNTSADGVSVAEESGDPDSVLAWYRTLLGLRASRSEVRSGSQRLLCETDPDLLCVLREKDGERTLIVANLGMTAKAFPQTIAAMAMAPLVADDASAQIAPMGVAIFGTIEMPGARDHPR